MAQPSWRIIKVDPEEIPQVKSVKEKLKDCHRYCTPKGIKVTIYDQNGNVHKEYHLKERSDGRLRYPDELVNCRDCNIGCECEKKNNKNL